MVDASVKLWSQALGKIPGILPDISDEDKITVSSIAPVFAREGREGVLTDVEGREYVDTMMCWGAFILGYQCPAVDQAVRRQMDKGMGFSIASELQVEVDDRLINLIPCAEQLYFGKNGSDACTTAVRIAHAVTKRDEIAVCAGHFHGYHDWFACSLPFVKGLPKKRRRKDPPVLIQQSGLTALHL